MSGRSSRFWQAPAPLTPWMARAIAVAAPCMLLLAIWGMYAYEGLFRIAFVIAFVAIGASNLCWAVGSLTPHAAAGERLRALSRPFSIIALIALPVVLWFQFTG